jgi:hypothetical protein
MMDRVGDGYVEGEGEEVRGGDGEGTGPGEMVGEVSYQLRQVYEVSSLCKCENKGIRTSSVIFGLTVFVFDGMGQCPCLTPSPSTGKYYLLR